MARKIQSLRFQTLGLWKCVCIQWVFCCVLGKLQTCLCVCVCVCVCEVSSFRVWEMCLHSVSLLLYVGKTVNMPVCVCVCVCVCVKHPDYGRTLTLSTRLEQWQHWMCTEYICAHFLPSLHPISQAAVLSYTTPLVFKILCPYLFWYLANPWISCS